MYYEKMIAEEFGITLEEAEKIADVMSMSGFKFSNASREMILNTAGFHLKYALELE